MDENLIKSPDSVTLKDKLIKFYTTNKILIFSGVIFLIILVISFSFYAEIIKNKKKILAENYIQAKIFLEDGKKDKAKGILKDIVLSDGETYSALSLFLILNENLINDKEEISSLFDQVLENNKFEKEVKNLILLKKALFLSNFVDETELLESVKPLISADTLWKPHTLLLLGDFFAAKQENIKAKEFYAQVLSLKKLHPDLYEQARSQLILISND